MPAPNGPGAPIVADLNDPLASLLVLTGRSGAELVAAANALSLGSHLMSGERMALIAPMMAARRD